jgi:hypothetical protein
MICGGPGEGGDAVVDPNQAVAGEVDAEGDAEKRVGEGPVSDSHSCLRRAGGDVSYILTDVGLVARALVAEEFAHSSVGGLGLWLVMIVALW